MKHALLGAVAILLLGMATNSVAAAAVVAASRAQTPQVVPNTMTPLVQGASVTSAVPADQTLALTVTLRPRDQAALDQFVTAVATPGSPRFRHFMTSLQFAQTFGPDAPTLQATEQFLQTAGLHIVQVQSGGLAIHVSGTARQVAAALHVTLNTYRAADGRTFFANDRDITLPATLASAVVGIAGLDSVTQLHPHLAAGGKHRSPMVTPKTSCPSAGASYYTVPQLGTAYHFPQGVNAARTGIALLELDGYLPSDITAFAVCYAAGVNVANIVQPRLVDTSTPLAAGDSADEDELDIDIALGLAPTLGKISVYEAPNAGSSWMDLLATIASDNTDGTVSISWGGCEADSSRTYATSENVYFQQMSAQGQSVFAAAGDTGAYDCLPNDGSGNGNRTLNVDDPAANPNVVAVGGTALATNGTETVWNSSGSGSYSATGGGVSQYWSAPTWQVNAHIGAQSARLVPDITADADPNTGTLFYLALPGSSPGWYLTGGTSAAAPTWAALAALTSAQAGTRIGLITPALYALYGADAQGSSAAGITVAGTTYYDYPQQVNGAQPAGNTFVLHDITVGNNTFPGFAAGFSAQRGFDNVSGLGSMNGQTTAAYLGGLAASVSNPTPTPTTTPTSGNTPAGVYLAAKGSNGSYWVSANLTQTTSLPFANGNWMMLDSTPFQGAPAIATGGTQNGGAFWVVGIGTDGTARFGAWYSALQQFSGWQTLPGVSCNGDAATTYVQATLFVMCKTASGSLYINAYNTVNSTWGGWSWLGSGLVSAPTLATDGANLLILAQAPLRAGDQSDWYTLYTIGTGVTTQWRRFVTTCEATPAVAYRGATLQNYAISCIAGDTNDQWTNVFTVGTQSSSLSGWRNLGAPTHGVGFHLATSVVTDGASIGYATGLGTDNAVYMAVLPYGNGATQATWQRLSLPGVFAASASSAYFGG